MAEIQQPEIQDLAVVEELGEDSHWTQLAKKHWSKPAESKKVKPEVIKNEIWGALEKEQFLFRSLLLLENLQLLEKYGPPRQAWLMLIANSYLWPGYTDISTNYHVLLIALLVTVKSRENLPTWSEYIPNGFNGGSNCC